MKNLNEIAENLQYEGKIKKYFFNPVLSLNIGENSKILKDVFFDTENDAMNFASELINECYMLPVGFPASVAGACKCLVESESGYPDGPFEVKKTSSIKYLLK